MIQRELLNEKTPVYVLPNVLVSRDGETEPIEKYVILNGHVKIEREQEVKFQDGTTEKAKYIFHSRSECVGAMLFIAREKAIVLEGEMKQDARETRKIKKIIRKRLAKQNVKAVSDSRRRLTGDGEDTTRTERCIDGMSDDEIEDETPSSEEDSE